ncbi:hypothetical protein [Ruminococcus albus]|uniref:hypothetical protein n=1 Tax=Ruminococcus albus TaxID=1264 RepID=UPI000943D2E8|nr:hypothetical protein [Ruminococcus albus]
MRDGIETKKSKVGVANRYHIKSVKRGNIQTSLGGKELVLKNPNVNREERLRQLRDIDRRKDYFKSRKLRFARKKYITAKGEEESPNNITTVQSALEAAGGVVQSGGAIRTAVGGTRNTVGRIQTAVKNGVKVGSVKDVGRTLGGAAAAAKNAAFGSVKETGHSLLKTKIDKSTTTDTGTEAIKQGLTDIRYVDNARKAIYNTAQGGIKTARSVRETKQTVGRDVQKIREKIIRKHRAKQAAKAKKTGKAAGAAAKKTASAVGKVVTSKGFIVVALGGGLLLLIVTLLNGFLSVILSAISSMLSWAIPKDGSNQYDYLQAYHVQVQAIEAELQANIDSELSYTPEYRYDGSEITSLKQWGNTTLSVDENAVIAAAAVKEFQNGNDKISDETIAEVIEHFYSFTHSTENGYCPDCDCMKDENTELTAAAGDFYVSNTAYVASTNEYAVSFRGTCYEHTSSVWTDLTMAMTDGGTITGTAYAGVSGSDWEVTYNIGADGFNKIDWTDITIKATTIYCNNPDHTIYYGEVTNIDVETGLASMGFTTEQESIFWTYYACLENGGF